jgi:hypothetical protein
VNETEPINSVPIAGSFTWTRRDVDVLHRESYRAVSWFVPGPGMVGFSFFAFVLVTGWALLVRNGRFDIHSWMSGFMAAGLLVSLAEALNMHNRKNKIWNEILASGPRVKFESQREATVVNFERSQVQFAWRDFKSIKQIKGYFVLLSKFDVVTLIPLRAFRNSDSAARFLEFARQRIEEERPRKGFEVLPAPDNADTPPTDGKNCY